MFSLVSSKFLAMRKYSVIQCICTYLINENVIMYVYYPIFRSTKCEYLDGSCLASPRWVSLLVAEIYYPDATFPNPTPTGQQPPQTRNPVQAANPPSVSCHPLFSVASGINFQHLG